MLLRRLSKPFSFQKPPWVTSDLHRSSHGLRLLCANSQTTLPQQKQKESLQLSLDKVTVINTAKDAAKATSALLELSEDRHVAWSVQSPPNPSAAPTTLTAYGGEDVDFGNGPHLIIFGLDETKDSKQIWELFKRYFQDEQAKKIWFNYSHVEPVLSKSGTQPVGFSGDLMTMASLLLKDPEENTLQGFASRYLSAQERRTCTAASPLNNLVSEETPRPWGGLMKLSHEAVNKTWVAAACTDAVLVSSIYQKLQDMLKDTRVLNRQSFSQSANESENMKQLYSSFFVPLVKQLYEIQQRVVCLDKGFLEKEKKEAERDIALQEQKFLTWASQFSPEAKHMDLYNKAQLRHLLFAPCVNKHDKTQSLTSEMLFKSSKSKLSETESNSSVEGTKKGKFEFTLRGFGAHAADFTKSGWPSVSIPALRNATKSGREKLPGFAKNDDAFCDSVESLLCASEIRSHVLSQTTDIDRLPNSNKRLCLSYEVNRAPGLLKLTDDTRKIEGLVQNALSAEPGNVLLVGRFLNLEQELLHVFSGCKSLHQRLEQGDIHEQLALSLFKDVADAVDKGECIVSGPPRLDPDNEYPVKTIADQFPKEYSQAKILAWSLVRGFGPAVVKKRLKLSTEEVKRLMGIWRDMHPGVVAWQKECMLQARVDGVVGSIAGRMMKVRSRTVRGEKYVVWWDALDKLMTASVGDVVMEAVIKCGEHETLRALGWHVAFIDKDAVVLQGPKHAVKTATDIVRSAMELSTKFGVETYLPVRLMEGTSMATLEEKEKSATENENNELSPSSDSSIHY